jgi:hypothetical protein
LQLTTVDGDGITTPDVLRVDIGETDVLNDNVLDAADHADTLSLDNTLVALADQRLVGANSHTEHTSLVVGDAGDLGRVLLVVVTPSVLVDGNLTSRTSAPGTATSRGDLTLGAGEVKSLGEDNGASLGVAEVADELSVGLGVDRCGFATTSNTCSSISVRSESDTNRRHTLGETLGSALDAIGSANSGSDSSRNGGKERVLHSRTLAGANLK